MVFSIYFRFFSKAKKAAMTPLAPPPAPPTVPRLVEDVVPDDRDDPEIILNTTTVSYTSSANARVRCQNYSLCKVHGLGWYDLLSLLIGIYCMVASYLLSYYSISR